MPAKLKEYHMKVKHRRPGKGIIPTGHEYVLKWSKKLNGFTRYPEINAPEAETSPESPRKITA